MTDNQKNKTSNNNNKNHSHGGKRLGSGRPKGSGKYNEPTKAIRVPEGSISHIKSFLSNEYHSLKNTSNNTSNNTSVANITNLHSNSNVSVLASANQDFSEEKQSFPLFNSKVAAGLPSYADDDLDDSIDLNDYLVQKPNSTFMLKVQGMSMRDAGILPDDILIVDRSERATHNKIVIAALDGELTVKRLFRRGDIVKLLPENPDYPEIILQKESQLIIWGVVIGSFRRFEVTKFT